MAFHQRTAAPAARPSTASASEQYMPTRRPSFQQDLGESHEWVLFPSAQDQSSTHTVTAPTERTPRTAGLSRLSDFGSLDSAARSEQEAGVEGEATTGSLDEDEDLDSLDDGLHAFQQSSQTQRSGYFDQSGSILPRHDGLGTFPASSPPVQEHLWRFEQYNPRKRPLAELHRRRSSVQRRLDAAEDHDAFGLEAERRERIEKWRMEQSRLLLDEIEKQTRRRRMSILSQRPGRSSSAAGLEQIINETVKGQIPERDPEESPKADTSSSEDSESFLERITRRVIRDFIGIDDVMLSVMFGESLPADNPTNTQQPSTTRSASFSDPPTPNPSESWEKQLLDRLARELGILIHQLSDHPGAFSAPSTSDHSIIPPTQPRQSTHHYHQPTPTVPTSPSFDFSPTLNDIHPPTPTTESHHASLWGIEEEAEPPPHEKPKDLLDQEDYWTQPPTLKSLFHLLRTHLTTYHHHPSPSPTPTTNLATTTTPASLHRTALIRQHHPLVSSRTASQRENNYYNRSDARHATRRRAAQKHVLGSSCGGGGGGGSTSGRRSRRGGTLSMTSGASTRNFWDLGGSGGGSAVGSAIGVGGWGEV